MTGYSGTPLAKKLGIKPGFNISLVNTSEYYFKLFTDFPVEITVNNDSSTPKDLIHIFVKQQDEYLAQLPKLKQQLKPNGIIWASWPKKSSGMVTNVTESIIRDYALQIGLVDIKVCAVDETWSGLKLVIPIKDR